MNYITIYMKDIFLMNDFMYDEIPVVVTKYKFDDWKIYAVHDEMSIKGFFGDYRWLSNFFEAEVYYDGLKYHSSENAYQAAKVQEDYRHQLQICTYAESKKIWKSLPLIDDSPEQWDDRKYDVMSSIVFDKFLRNKKLRNLLLETKDKYLEELNHWKDSYWGVDIKIGGQNNLGKILMKIRNYWK